MDSCLMCHCETGVLVMQDATCIDSTVSQFTPVSSSLPSMLTNHSSICRYEHFIVYKYWSCIFRIAFSCSQVLETSFTVDRFINGRSFPSAFVFDLFSTFSFATLEPCQTSVIFISLPLCFGLYFGSPFQNISLDITMMKKFKK